MTERTLYYAYGSNLCIKQMQRRCPSAVPVVQARLHDHELCFRGFSGRWGGGVASVTKREGAIVHGALYLLHLSDLRRLDGYEGHPTVYKRQVVSVINGHDEDLPGEIKAWTYLHRDSDREDEASHPSMSYVSTIHEGYKAFRLPEDALFATVPDRTRVFVYGTFLRKESHHTLLDGASFLGTAKTKPLYEMINFSGHYPALRRVGGSYLDRDRRTAIVGEVYDLFSHELAILDRHLSCPHLYRRGQVELESGEKVLAYFLSDSSIMEGFPAIPTGNWRDRPSRSSGRRRSRAKAAAAAKGSVSSKEHLALPEGKTAPIIRRDGVTIVSS